VRPETVPASSAERSATTSAQLNNETPLAMLEAAAKPPPRAAPGARQEYDS
jgi:hypothetical protein